MKRSMLTQLGGCLVHLDLQSGHEFSRKGLEYKVHVNRHKKWTKVSRSSAVEYAQPIKTIHMVHVIQSDRQIKTLWREGLFPEMAVYLHFQGRC